MRSRVIAGLLLCACLAATGCKTSQGNGEAQPQNSGAGYNPDSQKKDIRKSGAGGAGKETTPSKPGAAQTPSLPASKTDDGH